MVQLPTGGPNLPQEDRMVIQGNAALVELLVQEGIDLMVGNPGTTELPLMDALASDGRIRYVLGLQESVVLAVADGYAQATGRLVAVNLHAAPGLGNAMGMLFNAKKAGSPILVTAGQQDQSVLLSEPILGDDLATIARPLVKWSYEVRRLADLPRAVHRAATTALAPPSGPVFLSIPSDVLTDSAELELGAPTRIAAGVRPDRAALEHAARLIATARSPVIFAGDAVARCDAHDQIVRFAEMLGAPVYAEDLANSASFPTSHPLFAGTIARLGPLSGPRSPAMTSWCRLAPICSPCRSAAAPNRSRLAYRSSTLTWTRGSWAKTFPRRPPSSATPGRSFPNCGSRWKRPGPPPEFALPTM